MVLGMDQTKQMVLYALIFQTTFYMKKDAVKHRFFQGNDIVSTKRSHPHDIYTIMKKNSKNHLIIYATQTGTVEQYAWKFAGELASKFSLSFMCVDMRECNSEALRSLNNSPENVVVSFFVSIYDESEFPDDVLSFEKLLFELNKDKLARLHFTLFGLGNST